MRVGQVLTAATGTIADADGLTLADAGEAGFGYTYQWVRVDADGMSNPADIPGATGATYTVTASDAEKKLKVRVSFTDDLNSEEARESDGTAGNSVPTASDGRVTALENQDYTFTAADFNYADSDGDPLASVTIKVRPESGALKLDNARVRVDATVTRAQLDAGSLTYTPQTDQTGTGVAFFYFAVSDGAAESASVYTMTIDIAEDTDCAGTAAELDRRPRQRRGRAALGGAVKPRLLRDRPLRGPPRRGRRRAAGHGLGVRRAHLHAPGHRAGGRAAHVRGAGGEQLDPE